MRMRHLAAALAGALALSAMAAAPASAAKDAAFLAAHDINAATRAPGYTIKGNEISWNNGSVVMVPAVYGTGACPAGWVCIYETNNYNNGPYDHAARMLKWNLPGTKNMTAVTPDFNDKMSSWFNNSGHDACWFYNINGRGTGRSMPAHHSNPNVGADNDQMSSLVIYSTPKVC